MALAQRNTAKAASKLAIVQPQKSSVYQTESFNDVYTVCALCHEEKEIGVLTGAPGIGKTTALKDFAKDYEGEVLFFTARQEMSVRDFLQQLATPLGLGTLYGSAYERTCMVIERLKQYPRTIIVDEAENLARTSVSKLEILRHIFDDAQVGVILAGTPRLKTVLIKGPSRRENLSQLYSRVGYFREVTGLSEADVMHIISTHKTTASARNDLWQVAADIDHGGTRMFFKVWKLVQKLLTSEEQEISRDMVRQIKSKYLLTGRQIL